jgi:hypothetical protein
MVIIYVINIFNMAKLIGKSIYVAELIDCDCGTKSKMVSVTAKVDVNNKSVTVDNQTYTLKDKGHYLVSYGKGEGFKLGKRRDCWKLARKAEEEARKAREDSQNTIHIDGDFTDSLIITGNNKSGTKTSISVGNTHRSLICTGEFNTNGGSISFGDTYEVGSLTNANTKTVKTTYDPKKKVLKVGDLDRQIFNTGTINGNISFGNTYLSSEQKSPEEQVLQKERDDRIASELAEDLKAIADFEQNFLSTDSRPAKLSSG